MSTWTVSTGALVRGLSYRCTATLIAPDVAVTAAHCLADQGFGDFSFTLDADLSDGPDDLGKLGASNRIEAYRLARQKGWL